MTDLVLEHLKKIQSTLTDLRTEIAGLKERMGTLEGAVAGVKRDVADTYAAQMATNTRIDRWDGRLERIERRLELVD
jgi:septal ring factor EnvC (AmiA/AmiB activator)